MQAAIYIIVSTDEQAEEGYSLAAQERAGRLYCELQGLGEPLIYRDDGYSGRNGERPAFQRLLVDVRAGRVRAVIVHKLNRLARNSRLFLTVLGELDERKISFVSISEQIDFSTPIGKVIATVLSALGQFESDNLSTETAKGLREKAQQGRWVGPIPIGYAKDAEGALHPSSDASIVQRIFTLYASGQHTYTSIADVLNAEGATTLDWRSGERGRFERESVRTILKNRAYLGFVSSGGVEYRGRHEPLVSEELWLAANTLRTSRTKSHGSPVHTDTAWLTDRVYCEVCGEKYWHQKAGRQSALRYYRCCGINKRVCTARMARAETLEAEVLAILGSLTIPREQVDEVLAEARRLSGRPAQAVGAPADDALIQRLARLKLAYDEGILTRAEYEKKRREVQAAATVAEAKPGQFDEERAITLLQDIPRLMAVAIPVERKAVVGAVFERIWVEEKAVVALTPRADMSPILAGLANTQYGCLDGVPDGFQAVHLKPEPPYRLFLTVTRQAA